VLGGGHEPGAGLVGDACVWPLLERRHERVLGQLLGNADVADDARERGDQSRRFDAPDGVDGAVGLRKLQNRILTLDTTHDRTAWRRDGPMTHV
jgi:hypothetical protein